MCIPHFSTIHQLGLLLPFGSCVKCCYEHGCTNVSLKPCFQFLWVYNQKWNFWIIWHSTFNFFEVLPYCFPQQLFHFTFLPAVSNSYCSTHSHQHWCSFFLFFFLIVATHCTLDVQCYLTVILICISLISDLETSFMCFFFWPFVYLLWNNVYLSHLTVLKLDFVVIVVEL